jgi:hypothetical protein
VRKIAVCCAIFVAVAGSAGAATFYVDEVNGADDAARFGGPGDPWQTITYALSRTSGENTFMCRGTFEEEIKVDYDDRDSTFIANATAAIDGSIVTVNEAIILDLSNFDINGYAGGGCKGSVHVNHCRFNYPSGTAFQIDRFHGGGAASECVFENCKSVMSIGGFEFGMARFSGCTVKDCGSGIFYSGEASVSAAACRFEDVAGTAFNASIWGEFGTVSDCVFLNCGTGVAMAGTWFGGSGTIRNSAFKYNGAAIKALHEVEDYGGIAITDNVVTENYNTGVTVGGFFVKMRGNLITNNVAHGVYITEGNPDLGTPDDPGGNTFAGNGSGYDVYNVSPENIPAYGNTWDPESEAEMAGKTWEEVNVTRIYDHWDNPNVGYVMWSKPMPGVAPSSLGRIKASFRGEEAGSATSAPAAATH